MGLNVGEDLAVDIGRTVRRRRIATGFATQSELADALLAAAGDLTLPDRVQLARQISTWESGRHLPSALYRDLLCRVLHSSMDDLMLGDADVSIRETPMQQRAALSEAVAVLDRHLTELRRHTAETSTLRACLRSLLGDLDGVDQA